MVWTGLSSGTPQKGSVALAGGKILAIGDDALTERLRAMRGDMAAKVLTR